MPTLTSSFADWYEHYPRKVGRKAAKRSYEQAVAGLVQEGQTKDAAVARLLDRVRVYKASPKVRGQLRRGEASFIPHPATWLNQGRWDDDEHLEWEIPKLRPVSRVERSVNDEARAAVLLRYQKRERIADDERKRRKQRIAGVSTVGQSFGRLPVE